MEILTRKELAAVWWALIWRVTLFGLVIGAVLGGVAGMIMAVVGLPAYTPLVSGAAGLLVNGALTYVVLGHVLSRRYKTFKLKAERQVDAF
jgi:ABC-type xylose transport system permease subunit